MRKDCVMPRTSWLSSLQRLNISGESQEIEDGKIYASRRRKSLSEVLFDLLRPKVAADKEKHPEAYGDTPIIAADTTPTGGAAK